MLRHFFLYFDSTGKEYTFLGKKMDSSGFIFQNKVFFLIKKAMIDRDSWGHLYWLVRGEILGPSQDKLMRKHLTRMFSLIKNESQGLKDDQIPS